jgi:hypothetical protein
VTVPLGRGFAGGPTAVIDAADRLIRATYDDGINPASLTHARSGPGEAGSGASLGWRAVVRARITRFGQTDRARTLDVPRRHAGGHEGTHSLAHAPVLSKLQRRARLRGCIYWWGTQRGTRL